MSNITGDVIDVLVKLGLVESNGGGGVTPGLRKITDASGNTVLVGPDGLPLDLGVGLTETSPGSGIYLAEVANKVDTAANLRLYAGADGQFSAASDVDAVFRHTGVAGEAIGDYRNGHVGRAAVQLVSQARANGSALDFAGGNVVVDTLGVISIASDNITIPAGIDYYDVNFYLPLSENSGATNTQRKISMLIGGATPSPYQITGLTDITLTGVHSGQIIGDMKHVTKTKALTNVLTFVFAHNSAVDPNIGGPATPPRITVDMYRND